MADHPKGHRSNHLPGAKIPHGVTGGEDQSSGLRPGSGTSAETTAEWDRTHPSGGHNLSKEPGRRG